MVPIHNNIRQYNTIILIIKVAVDTILQGLNKCRIKIKF